MTESIIAKFMCISVPLSRFRNCTQISNFNMAFQVMRDDTNPEALGVKTRYLGLPPPSRCGRSAGLVPISCRVLLFRFLVELLG